MPTPRFGRSFKAPDENGCQKASDAWLIMTDGVANDRWGAGLMEAECDNALLDSTEHE